tara:strand:- start:620 stop:1738 length:1119 start_codon:yes stop_codon:yes gene_type:complete
MILIQKIAWEDASKLEVSKDYEKLLEHIFYHTDETFPLSSEIIFLRKALIALVVHTRDIVAGRGKYQPFYMLIASLDKTIDKHEELVSHQKTNEMRGILWTIIAKNVNHEGDSRGYGSWKDMKYLLNHLRDIYGEDALVKKQIFIYIISLFSEQLKRDMNILLYEESQRKKITLAGKWAPREKSSKFGWQAKYIALRLNFPWLITGNDLSNVSTPAMNKCLTYYRRTIASINRELQTPQTNQCAKDWSSIDFKTRVSKTTMAKNALAFQYVTNDGALRSLSGDDYDDRINCRNNFMNHKKERVRTTLPHMPYMPHMHMNQECECDFDSSRGHSSQHIHVTEDTDDLYYNRGYWEFIMNKLRHERYLWIWNEV